MNSHARLYSYNYLSNHLDPDDCDMSTSLKFSFKEIFATYGFISNLIFSKSTDLV